MHHLCKSSDTCCMARLALPLPRIDHSCSALEAQTGDMGPNTQPWWLCATCTGSSGRWIRLSALPDRGPARTSRPTWRCKATWHTLGQFRGNSDHANPRPLRARRHFDVKRGGETQATPPRSLAAEGRGAFAARATPQLPSGETAPDGSRLTMLATSTSWLDGGMAERSHPALKARTRFPSRSLL